MEAVINSVISELETFEANVLAPFFQNPDTMMGIMIAIGLVGLFYNVPNNVKKLFDNVTYRLIWVLLIILVTLYNPYIGFLTGLLYLMFIKQSASKTEAFNNQYPDCPADGADITDKEPQSYAQEQLEILESKHETTHLQRVLEGSKQTMEQSIQQSL
jgi:hypothetical protein